MLQHDDNVNMMLSWCMKYNNTLNATFLHGTVTSQTNQTIFVTDATTLAPTTSASSPTTSANSPTTMVNSLTTNLETLLVTKQDETLIKHLGFAFIYF